MIYISGVLKVKSHRFCLNQKRINGIEIKGRIKIHSAAR